MDRGDRPGADGDPLTEVFLHLGDRLLGTAFAVLGHREDAREAVQEAFLRCWRHRDRGPPPRSLEAWVVSVVLNAARDFRRRRRVRRAAPLPPEDAMAPDARTADPPAQAERNEAVARAREALLLLPEAEKEVFLLRQNGDLSCSAIADHLGIPLGTVKTRMRSALRRLRAAVDPAAGGEAP